MGRSVNVVTTKQWQCAIAKCRVVDSYLGALRTFYACLVFVWSNGTTATESVCMHGLGTACYLPGKRMDQVGPHICLGVWVIGGSSAFSPKYRLFEDIGYEN